MKTMWMVLVAVGALAWSANWALACDTCGCKAKAKDATAKDTAVSVEQPAGHAGCKAATAKGACTAKTAAGETKPAATCPAECKRECCKTAAAKGEACKTCTEKGCAAKMKGACPAAAQEAKTDATAPATEAK